MKFYRENILEKKTAENVKIVGKVKIGLKARKRRTAFLKFNLSP